AIITLMTAVFTTSGTGEFAAEPGRLYEKMVTMQTFLGIAAVSALLVAALSLQRQQILLELQAANTELERRVEERTAFSRQLADIASSMLYIYDLVERRDVWGNRQMTSVLGYSRNEIDAGSGRQSLFHPDDAPRYAAHLARLQTLADEEVAEFEYRMKRADG